MAAVDARADQLLQVSPETPTGRARFAALGDLVLRDGFTLFHHVMGAQVSGSEAGDVSTAGSEAPMAERCDSPRRSKRREVIVTIDLPTLIGLRDNPSQLSGFGPIPARLARLVAEDAALRRMVTDPVTGKALDLDRRSRVPSDTLVTAIRAADPTCRFPGCTRARRPELDHATDWSLGGTTDVPNLQVLCGRHHALKTAGLWACETRSDGSVVWTGPHGRTAVRRSSRGDPALVA
jgi:hypothetical protein